MRLVVASLLVGCLVGCSSVPNCGTWEDSMHCRIRNDNAQRMARIEAEMPELMRQAEANIKARQREREAMEYAERWHNDQLRKQGYVVCEQRSAKVLACK